MSRSRKRAVEAFNGHNVAQVCPNIDIKCYLSDIVTLILLSVFEIMITRHIKKKKNNKNERPQILS